MSFSLEDCRFSTENNCFVSRSQLETPSYSPLTGKLDQFDTKADVCS